MQARHPRPDRGSPHINNQDIRTFIIRHDIGMKPVICLQTRHCRSEIKYFLRFHRHNILASFDNLETTMNEAVNKIIGEMQKKEIINKEYITREEAARLLNVTIPTLHRYAKAGKIRIYKSGKNSYTNSDTKITVKHEKTATEVLLLRFACGATGNRTRDTRIFSPLLYQLSYGTNFFFRATLSFDWDCKGRHFFLICKFIFKKNQTFF